MTYIADVAIVGIITALVSAAKTMGSPSRFAPLLSLALGIVYYVAFPVGAFVLNIFYGIIAGLSASGLYSGTKAIITPDPNPTTTITP